MGKTSGVSPGKPTRRQSWLRVVIGLALIAVACYSVWKNQQPANPPRKIEGGWQEGQYKLPQSPPAVVEKPTPAEAPPTTKVKEPASEESPARTIIRDQTIRDLDGNVAYEGDIDLTATLARIRAGERLRFRNDGSTFENRERRLPRKPSGHYKEYVHPTEELDGPGPQRVIIGKQGEVYYTADHYQTFLKVESP
jgi:guanyl-specific ribonuclease Sa